VGLTARLLSVAARRPHVLLVPVPGYASVRWAAEDSLDRLGWPRAASPADADVLLCCGSVGPELDSHLRVTWDAMPGPRVRSTVDTATSVDASLTLAAAGLADLPAHRQDAASRPAPALSAADARGDSADPAEMDSGGMDSGGMDSGGMDSGGMEDHAMRDGDDAESMHDDDDNMDMDMDMDMPGGLTMADRVEDRDGLRLEGLHASLGPLLPAWPAGLRLDVVLSGDVLVQAQVRRLDPLPDPAVAPELRALDALAMLLDATGWQDGALRARRGRAAGGAGPAVDDLLRRLVRARLLRWSLRHLPAPGDGDLVRHLDRLTAAVRSGAELGGARDEELATALVGLDVATAHLVVAAYGPLLTVPAHA
jgi:hypothetical protein